MATQGKWSGDWSGDWFGDIGGGGGNPVVFAGLRAAGVGSATLGAEVTTGGTIAYAALSVSGVGGATLGAITSGGQQQGFSAEVNLKPYYIKRGKKLHIFAKGEDADAFLDAERQAQEAIDKAKATSRQARRRLKNRVFSAVVPHETVDVDLLGELAKRYAINADIPALVAEQDYMQLVALSLLAQQMQDEEEVLMLLLS